MTQNSINTRNPVLQEVSAKSGQAWALNTVMPFDDTIPQSGEGTQVITVTITPKSSTSLLEITFSAGLLVRVTEFLSWALFQDSTADALAANGAFLRYGTNGYLKHYMTSGTTSATTFKIRIGPITGTGYLNANSGGTRTFGGLCQTILKVVEYYQ